MLTNDKLLDPDNPEFVLGVKQMDDTHQEFIELLNRMPALQGQEFYDAFEQLIQHTREHFESEGELMKQSAFPANREHDSEHLRVLGEMEQMKRSMLKRGSTQIARGYVELGMPIWFKLHAATMDSALAAHIKSRPTTVGGMAIEVTPQ
ncbi:MAG: hemerythrin [gamma proteobacterium symbiont of Phacoides pectinatus]